MQGRENLERRVRDLEAEVARLRAGGGYRTVRHRSAAEFGGLPLLAIAVGGGAAGWTALGGGAVGTYACGGAAFGEHVVSATRRDPEAVRHFEEHGLGAVCGPGPARARRAP